MWTSFRDHLSTITSLEAMHQGLLGKSFEWELAAVGPMEGGLSYKGMPGWDTGVGMAADMQDTQPSSRACDRDAGGAHEV